MIELDSPGDDMKRKPFYPQQALAVRLRAALDEADVSQAQLARACVVTEPSVHGWVTTGRIAKEHLPTIAALTGKTLDYFLVGLKTWRRVAAIALPIVILPQLAQFVNTQTIDALRYFVCVLCKIARTQILTHSLRDVRSLTMINSRSAIC